MNIKKDLENLLSETGLKVPQLVVLTGVNKDSIYRLLNGKREGVGMKTFEKLWPYLYGDKRPTKDKAA